MVTTNISQLEDEMQKKIELLKAELAKMRTGRANPAILSGIKVDCYGKELNINSLGSITAIDARTLSIVVWDKSLLKAVEKAIFNSNLSLNPVSDGNAVRVTMPVVTAERRRELAKLAKQFGENTKVVIRGMRRDSNNLLRELVKKKDLSEDEGKRLETSTQKLTDKFIDIVDVLISEKEKDLLDSL